MHLSLAWGYPCIILPLVLLLHAFTAVSTSLQDFNDLIAKMESDVLELAREIESLYNGRCTKLDLGSCSEANFDECRSSFPHPECPASIDRRIPECGSQDSLCSGTWDFTTTNVRLSIEVANGKDGNPTDSNVIESLCLTRSLDEWFVQKRQQDVDFWRTYGTEPRSMYYGTKDGAFRIYPARYSETCGTYDNLVRPWYVAGSSGPKNVIMVLDTSGSMDGLRLSFLKTAAKRVVETLGINDRIAIVPFSGSASLIGSSESTLLKGSQANKYSLLLQIDGLRASGATNFQAAFRTAFDLLDRSFAVEHNVDCNTAILFLTDGVMTDPNPNVVSADEVMDEIAYGIANRQVKSGKPIILFTYSVSDDSLVDEFPKRLSCRVEHGIWSKISKESQIVDGLSNYYRLFALDLSRDEAFTSWVEPYTFATGSVNGSTVSAPVYDRTLDPPVFLGVAAVDFTMQSFDLALGNDIGSQATIDQFNARPAICPRLGLSKCMLESFRRQGLGGNNALCFGTNQNTSCTSTDFAQFEPADCSLQDDYPSNLWDNVDYNRLGFEERTCCAVGETVVGPAEEGQCLKGNRLSVNRLSSGAIAGIVIGSIAGICILFVIAYRCCQTNGVVSTIPQRKDLTQCSQDNNPSVVNEYESSTMTEREPYSSVEVMKPPPRNPSAPIAIEQ